jgi:hypothetical protein
MKTQGEGEPEPPWNSEIGGLHNAPRMIREGRYPGKVCGAKGKRSGKPCRRPASKGRTRCYLHAGRPPKDAKPRGPSPRVIRNRNARAARRAQRDAYGAAVERGELHPETMGVFAARWAQKVPEREHPEFIMALDQRIRGQLSVEAWGVCVRAYV